MKTFSQLMIASSLLCVAGVSHAGSTEAVDACVKAFVASKLPAEHPVSIDKSSITAMPADPMARSYLVALTATGATSGKAFATTTCHALRDGTIIALDGRSAKDRLAMTEHEAAGR
jgi:hypothetical protein